MAIEIFKKSHAIFFPETWRFLKLAIFGDFPAIFGPKLALFRDFGLRKNYFLPLAKFVQSLGL